MESTTNIANIAKAMSPYQNNPTQEPPTPRREVMALPPLDDELTASQTTDMTAN